MAIKKIRKRKTVKAISATLSFVCFFLILGTVGAIERDAIPLAQGVIRSILYLSLFAFFTYLGCAFEHD